VNRSRTDSTHVWLLHCCLLVGVGDVGAPTVLDAGPFGALMYAFFSIGAGSAAPSGGPVRSEPCCPCAASLTQSAELRECVQRHSDRGDGGNADERRPALVQPALSLVSHVGSAGGVAGWGRNAWVGREVGWVRSERSKERVSRSGQLLTLRLYGVCSGCGAQRRLRVHGLGDQDWQRALLVCALLGCIRFLSVRSVCLLLWLVTALSHPLTPGPQCSWRPCSKLSTTRKTCSGLRCTRPPSRCVASCDLCSVPVCFQRE
jgi:hypothetical protein